MDRGSIARAASNQWVVAVALVGGIVVCAGLLVFLDLSKPWSVAIQVVSAVLGALLGNSLRLDFQRSVVHNQARPAIRHLFDQVSRLRHLVQTAEGYQARLEQESDRETTVDQRRVADWFGSVGTQLRFEIDATAGSISNWGDLAPTVRVSELEGYQTRDKALPSKNENEAQESE